MSLGLDQLKRDFARNRKKAAILCVLSVIMVVFTVRAVIQLSPRQAEAMVNPVKANNKIAVLSPDDEQRVANSRELWKTLRETRGMDASVAFTFDPSYFQLDPSRPHPVMDSHVDANVAPRPVVVTEEQRIARIKEDAKALILRSTVIGTGTSKSVAVINDKVSSVGDAVGDFELTAIRAREVEIKKDGITLVVKMADDKSGQ